MPLATAAAVQHKFLFGELSHEVESNLIAELDRLKGSGAGEALIEQIRLAHQARWLARNSDWIGRRKSPRVFKRPVLCETIPALQAAIENAGGKPQDETPPPADDPADAKIIEACTPDHCLELVGSNAALGEFEKTLEAKKKALNQRAATLIDVYLVLATKAERIEFFARHRALLSKSDFRWTEYSSMEKAEVFNETVKRVFAHNKQRLVSDENASRHYIALRRFP
jgi:hypothetical protein